MKLTSGCNFLALLALAPAALADEPWKRHTIDDSSQGADGVRLADVNGDGRMDIATGWEEGGVVRAYLHPGRDREQEKWPAVTVGKVKSPEDAVFADLDGDGAVDVISSCEGATRSVFVHWAPKDRADYLKPEAWKTESIPSVSGRRQWMYALPMQIDGKHGVDLIVGAKGAGAVIGWLQAPENPRELANWKAHKIQDAGWIMSLEAADMNGDGDDDLLVSDRRGKGRGVFWLERPKDPTGEWPRHAIGGADREILFLSRGDVDMDGKPDVVAIEKRGVVWFRALDRGWSEHFIPMPKGTGGGKSTAVCDVDGDGRNDIVFSCEGAAGPLSGMRWLSWEKSPTAGPWTSHEIAGEAGLKYDRVVPYDIDGDGDLDMLNCEERDGLGVFWYENPHKKVVPLEDISAFLEPLRAEAKVPALGAAVIASGRLRALGVTGLRVHAGEEKVTVADKWHIGSCTKSMTATLAARMVEEGSIKWESTAGEIFGDDLPMHEDFHDVTLKMLLAHRGGLPNEIAALTMSEAYRAQHRGAGNVRVQRRAFLKTMLRAGPESEPGSSFEYSNTGYTLAGAMLEAVADRSWEELIRERLFTPLGMASAGFGGAASPGKQDQPWGHHPPNDPQAPGLQADNPLVIGPGATVHASLEDIARFCTLHARRETGPVLKRVDSFATLHAIAEGNDDYALGWAVHKRTWSGGAALHHSGTNTMNYCVIWIAPEREFAVITVSNIGGDVGFKACDRAVSALIDKYLD